MLSLRFTGVETICEDICRSIRDPRFTARLLDGVDCVVHLAGLSSDRLADSHGARLEEVNVIATAHLARAAMDRSLKFVFSSTAAVYGNCQYEVDEEAVARPLTKYAASKLEAENQLLRLETADWKPVILRNGTLFGPSPQMRTDLVVNRLCLDSIERASVRISGGDQWRPFVHVADCARAIMHFALKPECAHAIYNIAHTNLRIRDLVPLVLCAKPGTVVSYADKGHGDSADYRVGTMRSEREGFKPEIDIMTGIQQLLGSAPNGTSNLNGRSTG
jgi:nucleoside-diphosphate-sugar epimerase